MSSQEKDNHAFAYVKKEAIATSSTTKLPDRDKQTGLIFEDGSINWACPCLGSMVAGPCGVQFRDAFSCFHYSQAEPKGSDCMEVFSKMQECMLEYPALYGPKGNNVDDDLFNDEQNEPAEREKIKDSPKIGGGDLKEVVSDGVTNTEMTQNSSPKIGGGDIKEAVSNGDTNTKMAHSETQLNKKY